MIILSLLTYYETIFAVERNNILIRNTRPAPTTTSCANSKIRPYPCAGCTSLFHHFFKNKPTEKSTSWLRNKHLFELGLIQVAIILFQN